METNSVPLQDPGSSSAHQAYILVVEDELFVRMFISDALRDAGYKVLEAFNGEEAVEILDSGAHVDLILSDVRMPGAVDGLELLAFVRNNYPELPVFLASGHLDPTLPLANGAKHFLPKPFRIEHALELIGAVLDDVP